MESITKYAITGAVSFLVGGVIGYFIHKPKEVPQVHDNTITIIKHKRDSILQTINDTVFETIEKEYEKTVHDLLTLPPDKQCDVFSSYLSKNAWRLSGSNNSRSDENK